MVKSFVFDGCTKGWNETFYRKRDESLELNLIINGRNFEKVRRSTTSNNNHKHPYNSDSSTQVELSKVNSR